MAHPVVEIRARDGSSLLVVIDRRIDVGRACQGLLVDDDRLSRRHMSMWPDGGMVMVVDLDSRNGTIIDGKRLDGPRRLRVGQTVTVGDTTLRLTQLRARTERPSTFGATGQADRPTVGEPLAPTRPSETGADLAVRAADDRDVSRETKFETFAAQVGRRSSLADLVPSSGGTLTILFSDIEGSTERAAMLGDRRWFEVLRGYDREVRRTISAHRGRVVETAGDSYMVTFSSAVLAGQCAVELQRATKSFAGEERLRVRIGLHTGEVIQDGGQLVGLHVNTAARIAAIASGDQILVSSITRSIAEPSGALRFDEPREVQLKGLDQPHLVSELRWDPPSAEAD